MRIFIESRNLLLKEQLKTLFLRKKPSVTINFNDEYIDEADVCIIDHTLNASSKSSLELMNSLSKVILLLPPNYQKQNLYKYYHRGLLCSLDAPVPLDILVGVSFNLYAKQTNFVTIDLYSQKEKYSYRFDDFILKNVPMTLMQVGSTEILEISYTEHKTLEILLENPFQVVPRGQIFERINQFRSFESDRIVDITIHKLRNIFKRNNKGKLIKSIYGVGYMLQSHTKLTKE
ncbi:winged helix-turn-helix domain-containing protein [Cysteiniphilum sp. JM-1]|uniref:winged helix-turn-helix domain-containing protein n=1 Tax=Cysteiniphilum sp. JM-1 TaxID=2610891 RepID=UPI001246266D|nr:winged helix-turn-helix domain-containing protein [Cysteiniphilum sp. JM-1]